MFWFTLIMWAVSFAISTYMANEAAKDMQPKAARLDEFMFPTATEDRPIPWVWGKVRQKGPNVVWYGDYRVNKKKEDGGMFRSDVTVGYRYLLGLQMGLCKGPAVLTKVWYGDKLIWSGRLAGEGDVQINLKPNWRTWFDWFFIIARLQNNIPSMTYDYDNPPSGVLHFYPGTYDQTPDDYLSHFQSPCPAYRGLAYCIFDGFVSESPQVQAFAFEVERIPNGLELADPTIGEDANPMNVAYEIFTDVYGYLPADIDLPNFNTAAATLAAEGNGFSYLKDNTDRASAIIAMIEKQINGHFHLNAQSGKWQIELVRNDYVLDDLATLDDSNVTECKMFSRGTWTGTTNELRLSFINRSNDYMESSALAQDLANMAIQSVKIPTTVEMMGVREPVLATELAWRELRSMSVPLAMARVVTDRSLWFGYIGMPVKYNYNVSAPIAMRITKINVGSADQDSIEIDLCQDLFASGQATFAPPESGWTIPTTTMTEFAERTAMELPQAVVRRNGLTGPLIWTLAANQYDGAENYKITIDGIDDGTAALTGRGTVDGDISAEATTIDIACANIEARQFLTTTGTQIGQDLVNLILVGGELVAPTAVADLGDGTGLRLTGCYRGLCDTAPAVHANGEDVWFVCLGAGINNTTQTPSALISVKLIPTTVDSEVAAGDVTDIALQLARREDRPYPPTLLTLNALTFPVSTDIDSPVAVAFNRRDHRILDEVSQLATDAETLDGTFPAAETTQYRLRLKNLGSVVWTGAYNAGAASLTGPALVKIVRACDGCPTALTFCVTARHTTGGDTLEALQDIEHETTVVSALSNDFYLGTLDTGETSEPWTAPATGDYDFTLDVAIATDLQAKVNGGALQTIISSGNTTGTLTGVTEGDIIEIRHTDSASSDERLLRIDAPGVTTDAYAVLIFTNVYWQTGGFGRGGFGVGRFGR
ncbi:MAG: hypothetical protein EHM35_01055 [Planctomycetaceae bacterium]|nr:MAG: hypothetical protein EHM35_01055 [Planctomycetaceae bacterium]